MSVARPGFPGGTAVSHLTVYDWPTSDGLAGGSPHLHTASGEGYAAVGVAGRRRRAMAGRAPSIAGLFRGSRRGRCTGWSTTVFDVVMRRTPGCPRPCGDAVFTFPDESPLRWRGRAGCILACASSDEDVVDAAA